MLNANKDPWKILRKDLTTMAQTWSMLSYFNLAPTSRTSYLNMDRARLMYGLIMQMDMDMGNMISMQDYLDSSVQYIQARLPRSDHCLMQRSGS